MTTHRPQLAHRARPLRAARTARRGLRDCRPPRGELLFGSGFTYVPTEQTAARSHTEIRKRLFNDYFRARGAPELTSLFCDLDTIWAEELENPKYGVCFARPTTLAAGDDACRFQFARTPGFVAEDRLTPVR
jgi:hypothetical protein